MALAVGSICSGGVAVEDEMDIAGGVALLDQVGRAPTCRTRGNERPQCLPVGVGEFPRSSQASGLEHLHRVTVWWKVDLPPMMGSEHETSSYDALCKLLAGKSPDFF